MADTSPGSLVQYPCKASFCPLSVASTRIGGVVDSLHDCGRGKWRARGEGCFGGRRDSGACVVDRGEVGDGYLGVCGGFGGDPISWDDGVLGDGLAIIFRDGELAERHAWCGKDVIRGVAMLEVEGSRGDACGSADEWVDGCAIWVFVRQSPIERSSAYDVVASVERGVEVDDDLGNLAFEVCVVAEVDAEDGHCVAGALDGDMREVPAGARGAWDGVH